MSSASAALAAHYGPDQWCPEQLRFIDIYKRDVAAEVPSVQLTHSEWQEIVLLISEVAEVGDALSYFLRDPETALIQGQAMTKALQVARNLRQSLLGKS